MSIINEVKETIVDAKKKYDKEKYIQVLEEQITKLEKEYERLNTRLSKYEQNEFHLNQDHLELFKLFKDNNYYYYLEDITEYSKKSIDLEIALNELLEKEYFKKPGVVSIGSKMQLSIPEDKRIIFLQELKKQK